MPVTRINNNQVSDASAGNTYLGINAAAKLQNYSITSTKIANSLTYGSDLTITGNLTVNGNTTTIDTVNVVIEDPLLLLAAAQTGTPTLDIGFIGKRGTEDNIAFVWDEANDAFVTAFTTSEVTNTTITINSYASLKTFDANVTGNLSVAGTAGFVGNVTVANIAVSTGKSIDVGNNRIMNVGYPVANTDAVTKAYVDSVTSSGFTIEDDTANTTVVSAGDTVQLLGTANEVTVEITNVDQITFGLPDDVVVTANITAGNVNSNAAVTGVSGTFSGNVVAANLNANSGVTSTTVTASGNVLAGNVNSNAAVTGVSVTASGNVLAGNLNSNAAVTGVSGTFSGNVLAGNLNSNAAITGVTVTASGNLVGGNANITNGVYAATVTATGNVLAGNINSNAAVTGVTGTFSGNVDAGNVNVTTALNVPNLTVSGNVLAGNLNSNAAVTGVTITASGNLEGNNATITNQVNTATVVASGNVLAGNINSNAAVTGVTISGTTITASGNLNGNNLSVSNAISSATVVASGNITGGNLSSNAAINGVTITASGNVLAGNVNSNAAVTGVNGTFSGNVVAGNLNANAEVTATTMVASGNIGGGNILTNDIYGTVLTLHSVGDIDLMMTGNLNLDNKNINNLAAPFADTDAATKAYVDSVAQGLHVHAPSLAATPDTLANISSGTITYNNGTAGVGANLVTTGSFTFIDGVNVQTAGTRIIVKDEANAAHNGIYTWSNATVLIRATDFDTPAEMGGGDFTFVQQGTLYNDTGWVMTDPVVTVGTSPVYWLQFSGAGQYTAGPGLTLNGTQFSVNTDEITTTITAGNVVVKAGAQLVTPNIGNATGSSLTLNSGNGLVSATTVTATGNVSGGNLSATTNVSTTTLNASGNVLAANLNANLNVTGTTITATGNLEGNNATITNQVNAGAVVASGNVVAGNVNSNAAVTGVTATFSGNVLAGNINSNAAVTGTTISGTTITASGNVLAGNVNSNAAVTGVTGNFSGNLVAGNLESNGAFTAASITTAGNVLAGNVNSNAAVTGVTATFSGNVLAGNLNSNAAVTGVTISGTTITASGNLEGNNATITNGVSAATVTASGNVLAGNVNSNAAVTGVTITASGNLVGGNANITNGVYAATVTTTGNVLAGNLNSNAAVTGVTGNFSGNLVAGNLESNGAFTAASITTAGNVLAGNVNSNAAVTGVSATFSGNVLAGNLNSNAAVTGVSVTASGNVLAGNVNSNAAVTGVSGTFTGNLAAGNISTAGQANLGNIVISGDNITDTNGRVNFNTALGDVDFAVNGTGANVFYVDAGTNTASFGSATQTTGALVAFNSSNSVLMPSGNTAQRPTGVTGMLRFNTTLNKLELFDNSTWSAAGSEITVIVADSFEGNGVQTNFTLSQASTTASTIVSINGVVQIPGTAYGVTGNVLAFTEAPAVTDHIDARILTTTTTVTGLVNGTNTASVYVSEVAAEVDVKGNLLPTGNLLYNLGSPTNFWNTLYVGGNSIHLGSLILKDNGSNTFAVYTADGTTEANIAVGNIDVTSLSSGTSTIGIAAPNGNGYITAGGNTTLVVTSTGANIAGTVTATGNITGNYILGNGSQLTGIDATSIQSGTSAVSVISSGGNIRANVAGATVQVLSTGGANVTGYVTATGNITGNYILGNGSQLTGIDATSIQNGTANVRTFLNGNVTVSAAGTANVFTVTSTGANIAGTLNTGTGNANVGNLGATTVTGGNISLGGDTISSTQATITIDPASAGADGLVVIAGNLQVNGTTTTINSQTLTINDLLINVANNAATSSAADGAGLAVGAPGSEFAKLTFDNANTRWTTSIPLNVTGNVTAGNLSVSTGTVTLGNIVNANANGTGNIGSATTYFNTVFAKATSAQYADLAEMYEADAAYAPGTVVEFGGDKEVTQANEAGTHRIAGVVSTNPSYLMNSAQTGEHVVAVALQGRVPCKVIGPVRKGDMMVAAGNGAAKVDNAARAGTIIGKALENFNGAEGTIEVVVGRN